MRKLNCPQCNIPNFYIMNDAGERRLVYVMEDLSICPKNEGESLDGVLAGMVQRNELSRDITGR